MTHPSKKSQWIQGMHEPCDPEIFKRALEVWQVGADFPLRAQPVVAPGYVLADIEINRAAMATIGFLRARGVAQPQSYLLRLMHFGEVLDAARAGGVLAKFVKASDEDGCVLISDALIEALATAPIPVPAEPSAPLNGPYLDLDEIARLAQAAFDEDEAPGKGAV